jgi:septation ring formation regulator EzrA
MKQSVTTGVAIYKELFELNKELEEAEVAAKLVADELGEYTSAYKILSKAVTDINERLKAAENRQYKEALITPSSGDSRIY